MVLKYLFQAYKGKIFWTFLKKKYGNGRYPSRYVIYPSRDLEYNFWGLYYLVDFIKGNKLSHVTILTMDDGIREICSHFKFTRITAIKIDEKKMGCLIRYAALVNRMEEWTIVSVKEPFDTGAERLLGKKGVKKGDIVWYDIFRMSESPGEFEPERMEQFPGLEKVRENLGIDRIGSNAG